jgi:hypothetical protein
VPDFLPTHAREVASRAGTPPVSGSLELAAPRLSERAARAILEERFGGAGYRLETDFPFHEGSISVIFDGFDCSARIGYQYISHADADVVTDHDRGTESALKQLEAAARLRILVIHDVDIATSADLNARIDEFLGLLQL